MRSSKPGRMILLVGSNPLPSYLSAIAFQPEELALVHTSETEVAKDRLKTELRRALPKVRFVEPDPYVGDATCASTVRRAIDALLEPGASNHAHRGNVWLNYTGGTKVMAAHARMNFADRGGAPARSTYLDEGRGGAAPRIRFDDGRSMTLVGAGIPALSLRTVLALHGIVHKPRTHLPGHPTKNDAEAILCAVLRDPGLAQRLYDERCLLRDLKNPKKASVQPFLPANHQLELSIQALPHAGMNRKLYEHWYRFIGGEWLEEWLGTQLHGLPGTRDITVGVNAWRGELQAPLEVDVAFMRGHRSYFISCTTDTTKSRCKSKLFEIAVRSRQLGGDLARAALLCLANGETVGALQRDIDDLWGATNTTRVFGIDDLKTWSGHGGQQPDPHALHAWMES